MTMKAKAGIAAAAVALLALLGWLALGGGDGGRAAPAADPEAGKPDVAVAPAAPPPAPPAPPPEEPAPPAPAVEPPAPAPRTGTIVVRLVDRGTGKAVKGIGVSFSGPGVGYRQRRAEGDSMEEVLDLTPGVEQETVTVTILPEGTSVALSGPPLSRSVVVAPGARVEAEFEWSPPPEIRGRILAADGTPVEGALVFLGEQVLARGDEPFKPFDERRVPQAVRTDASGEFALRGHGRVVTAWHATHSPVTVPVASVGEIRLPARGTVRGRLVDAAGAPVAGIEVALDRTRKATTDGEGRFSFDAVEAGVRGLLLPKKRYIALRVAPGETSEFEVGPGLPEVRVGIRKDGKPIAGPLRGALVGLDRVASVHDVKVADGAFTLSGVLPGRFLLVTMSGPIAFVDVRGPTATVELGAAALTVKAPAGTSVALAPAESDFLVDLMAMRVGHRRGAGGVGVDPLVFLDLPDGAYRILVEDPPGSGRKAGEVPVVIEGGKDATVDLSTAK